MDYLLLGVISKETRITKTNNTLGASCEDYRRIGLDLKHNVFLYFIQKNKMLPTTKLN